MFDEGREFEAVASGKRRGCRRVSSVDVVSSTQLYNASGDGRRRQLVAAATRSRRDWRRVDGDGRRVEVDG